MEELFNRFMRLKNNIQSLAGIVQNEGTVVEKEELEEWNRIAGECQTEVGNLIKVVNELYN